MARKVALAVVLVLAVIAVLHVSVDSARPSSPTMGSSFPIDRRSPHDAAAAPAAGDDTRGMDLRGFSDAPPASPLRLLFLHHSVGGALFAAPGPADEVARCIWRTHPDGGDARARLTAAGY